MSEKTCFTLDHSELPKQWYNVAADMPNPAQPPLHPGTGQPVGPDDLAPLFPMDLILQEVSQERWIDIPPEVLDIYSMWRPTPLYRARRLEKALGTPAKIYYKYEGGSPAGSHKPNTAVPQAFYNKKAGIKKIATETGAGQWGSALSFAAQMFGLEALVYMVKVSYYQKPYRRSMMQCWGGKVLASPSDTTQIGKKILAQDPDSPGSLGIAISEAVEVAASNSDTNYSLGSVLSHVLLHQSVIGLEAEKQMKLAGDYPDVVIGCCGGGSNFAGISNAFVKNKIAGKDTRIVAVEPASCPTLTKGIYSYDFGDTGQMTPLLAAHTLGHDFVPPSIHAGGLRYHSVASQTSQLMLDGIIEAAAYPQVECFEAAVTFCRAEGIIPAPESSHAIRQAIVEAMKAKEEGKERTILFNLSGHGHFDMTAYDHYFAGDLVDDHMDEAGVEKALAAIAQLPKPAGYTGKPTRV
ncbi:MAG: TrpB-like pyridoxal phosphate-dependent enzyme [Nitrospinota bacterium]|nr:TrpB-like pyridoxal phosphate-dependent enzyme [Nitrospinota bacterium]MDH5678530.1 TrpB-like pyridoxal phosphate-dependent enzyme [Nitrospinota bacterium]